MGVVVAVEVCIRMEDPTGGWDSSDGMGVDYLLEAPSLPAVGVIRVYSTCTVLWMPTSLQYQVLV